MENDYNSQGERIINECCDQHRSMQGKMDSCLEGGQKLAGKYNYNTMYSNF